MRNLLKNILLVNLILLLAGQNSIGQTHKIDSLQNLFSKKQSADSQGEILIKLCEQHVSMPAESLLKYVRIGEKIFIPGSPEYFRIRNFYNTYLSKTGKVSEALALSDSLLKEIPREDKFNMARFSLLLSRCNLLIRNNQTKEAFENSFRLLSQAEQLHDTVLIVRVYILLGWANMELENYTDAITWLNKGIHLSTNENILKQSSYLFSNIASSYNNINKRDSAFKAIEKALYYSRLDENLSVQANALNIRADMYIKEKNYAAAENDLKESLKAREQIGDKLYIIADLGQLSSFYASINQTAKGIETAQKGIVLARKLNNHSQLIFLNSALAENYKKAGLMNEYADVLNTIINLKDSLYEKNSADAIAEMGAKYELQKKENIIIRQEYDLTRNRAVTIGSIILLVFGLILTRLLYKNYQHRQRLKMETAIAEEKKLAREAVVAAEENERKRIAADLHDNLGSFAAAITSNVKYLKESVESKEEITLQLEENAQSMVSQLSDTIWVLKNEHLPFTKLADRFKVWMQRLIKNYPDVKYHYTEEITDDVEFTPVKILHVFLILKECVTNALKHSSCSDLKIHFCSTDNLIITIEDNGTGIENNNSTGNGIVNIKYRAAESGWNAEWQNISPSGTRVMLTGTTAK